MQLWYLIFSVENYNKNLIFMLGFMASVHICTVGSTNTNLACASRWTVKQTLRFHWQSRCRMS